MKKTLALALIVLCAAPVVMNAQKKPAPKTRKRTPAAAPTPAPVNMVEAANKVAEQLKLVSRFIFVYGKVANGLQIAEDQTKRGDTSPALAARNQQVKQNIVTNVNGLRAGIDKIALEFKSDDRLQVQYLKLTGASDAVAAAEQLAVVGNYDDAGKSLVTAIERLADTIISLR